VLINLSASAMTLDLSQVTNLNQENTPHFTFMDLLNDEVLHEHHLRLAPYAFRFLKHL
jgi:hypothetical protein